jgi:hypothetical protein
MTILTQHRSLLASMLTAKSPWGKIATMGARGSGLPDVMLSWEGREVPLSFSRSTLILYARVRGKAAAAPCSAVDRIVGREMRACGVCRLWRVESSVPRISRLSYFGIAKSLLGLFIRALSS